MKHLLAVTLLLSSVSMSEATIACKAQKGDTGYWSWRTIDNKKCWYKGRAGVSKDELEWVTRIQAKPVVRQVQIKQPEWPNETPSQRDEREVLESGVWPALSEVEKIEVEPAPLTPQQRIDNAFNCLYLFSRGMNCE